VRRALGCVTSHTQLLDCVFVRVFGVRACFCVCACARVSVRARACVFVFVCAWCVYVRA
jgi:hypothetical protein